MYVFGSGWCGCRGGVRGLQDLVWVFPILWDVCVSLACGGVDCVGGDGYGAWTRVWRAGVRLVNNLIRT